MNKKRDEYKQQYENELFIYNLNKKEMPRSTRIILILICIFGLALWYAYIFKVI